ncbi:MAG: phospholipase A [Burkholderiaceae bacterium]|nr:phospholipase A [Burkholderiaceae bacterium]
MTRLRRTFAPHLMGCTFAILLLTGTPSYAGVSYQLMQPRAQAGDTVSIQGVVFNDADTALSWNAPAQLTLQWRSQDGQITRSLAYLESGDSLANVPVNNFVKFSWRAVVPTGVHGLQAVNIEGEATLLALDASPAGPNSITGTAANVPIVDAGVASGYNGVDPALPANVVAATGSNAQAGPAVRGQSLNTPSQSSAFDSFRSAISAYEPIYFDVGGKDGRDARYQVSFKYRLFTPNDATQPDFIDHLYFGYTQTALWDLHSDSMPFVDTSFKPSLFWRKDALWQSQDKQVFAGLATGVEHESNGKSGDVSRSLNFAYVQPELNYRFDGGSTLTFAPRVKAYFKMDPDNQDYRDYAGNVDWKLRYAQDQGLVLTGLYRHGHAGRNATTLEAAWPLRRTFLNMNGYLHVQYFKGYGETLLGYNHKSDSQVRVGLSLVP